MRTKRMAQVFILVLLAVVAFQPMLVAAFGCVDFIALAKNNADGACIAAGSSGAHHMDCDCYEDPETGNVTEGTCVTVCNPIIT